MESTMTKSILKQRNKGYMIDCYIERSKDDAESFLFC